MPNTYVTSQDPNVATGAGTLIYTVPGATKAVILSLLLCNKTDVEVTATVQLGPGTPTNIASQFPIPPRESLIVVGKDERVVLDAAGEVTVIASAATSIDSTFSALEIS